MSLVNQSLVKETSYIKK